MMKTSIQEISCHTYPVLYQVYMPFLLISKLLFISTSGNISYILNLPSFLFQMSKSRNKFTKGFCPSIEIVMWKILSLVNKLFIKMADSCVSALLSTASCHSYQSSCLSNSGAMPMCFSCSLRCFRLDFHLLNFTLLSSHNLQLTWLTSANS